MKTLQYLTLAAIMPILTAACSKSKAPSTPEVIRVETICASPSDISASRSYSGTVEEANGTTLSFSVPGTIRALSVQVGDRVSRGQLIGSIDPSSLQNAYQIAKSATDNARDAYNRMKMLHDANSLADMQWVQVQNTLKQAESAEAIARKSLSDASIHAPFAGYVAEKFVEAGSTVAPGLPVIRLVNIDPVKITISIAESEIGALKDGGEAEISVGALEGKSLTGRIVEKGVTADPISRTYDVKIEVANPDGQLLPGMICDVRLKTDSAAHAFVLPPSAVLLDAKNRNFVWLDSAGRAVKRIVDVSNISDEGIVIASGIASGDSVIVSGQQKVSTGSAVIPVTGK